TDQMTGLQWQKVGSAPASNWTAAQAYCADLFESGFGDWRLPTHIELQTLVDYTMDCAGPSVDLNFFPGTQSSYYWSSDALQGYPGSAWWVSYGSGAYYAGLVCSQGYSIACPSVPASGFTRCVRPSSAEREKDRYAFNSTQVLDTVTGLIWQRVVSGTYNWSAAQAYCAGLNLDGLSWRLPNVKELSTLLNVHVAFPGPTINATAFPSTPQTAFWTSTPYSCVSLSKWRVVFNSGNVGPLSVNNTGDVRCVRSPQVYNPEWANWQVTTGVYRDSANQTGRYLESVPGVITDQMTGLQWQKVESAPAGNWTAAQAYCADLFESGFGDWRLPTHIELQTLVDYTMDCAGPSVDLDFFPGTQTSSYYWASDALQGYPGSAWWVSYGNGAGYAGLVCSQGYSSCSAMPASGFTRCVRPSSTNREVDRYTFNNTQVLDTVTGLNWQRTVSGTYNWSSAQAYCEGLNLDGLSWRLPSVKELSTLLDVRVAYPGPTINATAFPSTPQSAFWTSIPYSCASSSNAWLVAFTFGNVVSNGMGGNNCVRCVRSPQVYNPEWANWQVATGVYQDNANQTGRYLESVPGVITDQMTGLQWQKVGSAPAGNWTAARAYCADLFESGFGDWRLPTHVQLQTLVDYTMDCAGPSVDLDFFPGTQTSSYYWSSDALQDYPGSAWWVSYGSGDYAGLVCSQGYSGCPSVPASGFARCVRPLSVDREVDRYTFNSTQVLDTVTGLIWQRIVSGTYNWSAAQAYCAGLNLDGLSWRLPNVKELSTLLDVRVAYPGPTINTTAFSSPPPAPFWTSTPYSCASSSIAWVIGFVNGQVYGYYMSNTYYVRCVR
ncbi:MAG: DUF1566 domain-containing protein, partial [Myxococcaceae bacterium]|nr:DUF1566 domain-containing protein [Myxococcaceae bacterium]